MVMYGKAEKKGGGGEGEQKECEWKKDLSSSVMDTEGHREK